MPEEVPKPTELQLGFSGFQPAAAEAARALRERAQEAHQRSPSIPEDFRDLSPEAAQKVLHELRVHQIELELQNEELRRAQQEVEASRARYFDLYDLAPVGYLTIAEKGLVLNANLTAANLLQVARSALIKQPWTRFVLAADQDIYFKHRKQLLHSGAPLSCELRLVKGNGDWFWARLEARISEEEDGTRACRTVLSDITERRRAEEALQATEARQRSFESSPDALLTLAPPSFSFTSANAAAATMFGASDEAEFLRRSPWQHSPERQPDGRLSAELACAMQTLAMQNGTHSYDWTYLRQPATPFRATVLLVRTETNGITSLQATVRDDTELQRKRAAAAQAERLASMGMLAASVGHEINNPLAYVLSNVETLAQLLPRVARVAGRCLELRAVVGDAAFSNVVGEDAALLEPAALDALSEYARDALDGAQRITRISRVLSAFSRADAHDLCSLDLQFAIESALSLAFNEIRFRAKLVKEFVPLPAVWASEGKLSQVFLNLLINAAHSLDERATGSQTITVRTWADASNVFAAVKDTGRGIPPENLAQVFEPFFSTKARGMGSGLGLSICRNIMAEFGGDIRVESKLGAGTRFIVRLPIPVASRNPRPQGVLGEPALPTVRGRVLVVDDEEPLRSVMKRLLGAHEVVMASSGKQAQTILELDQAFDVIVCDLMMPHVSGIDVHRWLNERNPGLAERMVFITGGVFGPVAAEYLSGTSNRKIEKPFGNQDFVHVVSACIRQAKNS